MTVAGARASNADIMTWLLPTAPKNVNIQFVTYKAVLSTANIKTET